MESVENRVLSPALMLREEVRNERQWEIICGDGSEHGEPWLPGPPGSNEDCVGAILMDFGCCSKKERDRWEEINEVRGPNSHEHIS